MRVNPWFVGSLLSFVAVESVALLLWDTYGRVTTVITLIFTFLFFGFFSIFFLLSAVGSSIDDWVSDIKRGGGIASPGLYFTWLYVNKRREWAVWGTIISTLFTLFFGSFLLYGAFPYEVLVPAYYTGVGLLVIVAVSWFEGYWKPRTRKTPKEVPESVKAEWADKRL